MPMTTFEELNSYKDKFYELLNDIRNCYDTKLFDNNMDTIISLDVKKLIKLSKSKLNIKYQKADLDLNM
jgi:hypothetical protein